MRTYIDLFLIANDNQKKELKSIFSKTDMQNDYFMKQKGKSYLDTEQTLLHAIKTTNKDNNDEYILYYKNDIIAFTSIDFNTRMTYIHGEVKPNLNLPANLIGTKEMLTLTPPTELELMTDHMLKLNFIQSMNDLTSEKSIQIINEIIRRVMVYPSKKWLYDQLLLLQMPEQKKLLMNANYVSLKNAHAFGFTFIQPTSRSQDKNTTSCESANNKKLT